MEQKIKKAQFGFDDYLESMNQMKNMGGFSKVLANAPRYGRGTDEAGGRFHRREAYGADRSHHPFHDTEGTGKSGSSQSFQEEAGSLPVREWTSVKSTSW